MLAIRTCGRLSAPALAAAMTLGAAPPSPAPVTAEVSYTAQERQEALSYWTPERMKEVGGTVDLGPTGPLTKTWKGAPVKTVGRLFFVNAKGADTWCTATAVKSGNRSVVMAAGHCVRLGSSPYNTYMNLVFAPGYAKGKAPYGVFPVRATVTPASWAQNSVNDVSALAVDPVQGKALTDAVGGRPVAFGHRPGGDVTAFGYPASTPQRGEELLYCAGHTKAAPDDEMSIPCDMTGGSSGGPWLADFDAASGLGTLVSVNSHGDALEHSTTMSGPVLGATARQVYDRAQRS
ncbi:trypsin-like serine peptidase [Streptoverticillium reticulum]|uniref:trypsin-like serine peptidase n=1 Tax=Streptoverticillium reticulum TaxID=1433415 RepID=UPI0039BF5B54